MKTGAESEICRKLKCCGDCMCASQKKIRKEQDRKSTWFTSRYLAGNDEQLG